MRKKGFFTNYIAGLLSPRFSWLAVSVAAISFSILTPAQVPNSTSKTSSNDKTDVANELSDNSSENETYAIKEENLKTHLRWGLVAPKDLLLVEEKKRPSGVTTLILKSVDFTFLASIANDLKTKKPDAKYIKAIKYDNRVDGPTGPSIEVELASSKVEAFNFFKDKEGRYIIDFWIEEETNPKAVALESSKENDGKKTEGQESGKVKTPAKNNSPPVAMATTKNEKSSGSNKDEKSSSSNKDNAKENTSSKVELVASVELEKKNEAVAPTQVIAPTHRDFRYGAAFFWDYSPLPPKFDLGVNLDRKGPDHFYPIDDRQFEKDEKEAHMQLTINLFRKAKWGLMYKSIKLYEQKYGEDSNQLLNEYIKANSIIKESIRNGDLTPVRMALNTLETIAERSTNYDLTKGILKYLLAYKVFNTDLISALKISKKLYVKSKENFDYEESGVMAEAILHCLAHLGQTDQIEEFLSEKTVEKLISGQVRLAYTIFAELKLGNIDQVIKVFEEQKANLAKPIHASILFNVAEAYFRKAKYNEAIPLLDTFITDYSHYTESSRARTRLGLVYEITERDPALIIALYKNAIDRSQNLENRYEAQIRYTALRNLRKIKVGESDKEIRVFLNNPMIESGAKGAKDPKDPNLKKLLWQVRLRVFIVDQEYKKALTYLSAIPLISLKQADARVFEEDGSEIVVGMIYEFYKKSDYPNVIRTWELYKEKYLDIVAFDPETHYIVAQSYLKMGLMDGLSRTGQMMDEMKKEPVKNYPIWIARSSAHGVDEYLQEIKLAKLVRQKRFGELAEEVAVLEKLAPQNKKTLYYQGLDFYSKKNYESAAKVFEKFMVEKGPSDLRDSTEVADLMKVYTDAVYETGNVEKFQSVAKALLNDTRTYGKEDAYVSNVKERIHYLFIESLAATDPSTRKDDGNRRVLDEIKHFKESYKKSTYQGRLDYLVALTLLHQDRVEEGKAMLNQLLKDESVSSYIKEMVRSELSLIKLKEKSI